MKNYRVYIDRNIVNCTHDIYLLSDGIYYTYENGIVVENHCADELYSTNKPFLVLPDIPVIREMFKQIAHEYNMQHGIKESTGEHIKDLRWVLKHFIDKDSR